VPLLRAVINTDGYIMAIDDAGHVFGVGFDPYSGDSTVHIEADTRYATPPKGSPALGGGQLMVPVANCTVLFFDSIKGEEQGSLLVPCLLQEPTGDIVMIDMPGNMNAMLTYAGDAVALYTWEDGKIPAAQPTCMFAAGKRISGVVVGKQSGQAPVAYASSMDGNIYAISIPDCLEKWQFPVNKAIQEDPAVSRDGAFVFINVEGKGTYKIDASTGQSVWVRPEDDVEGGASIVVGQDGTLYVGSRMGRFFAFEPELGDKLWEYDVGEAVESQAVIDSGGYVFFVDAGGRIHCLDAVSGALEWDLETNTAISGGLAIDLDHALYAVTQDGRFLRIVGHQPPALIPRVQPISQAVWSQRGGGPQHSGMSRYLGPPEAGDGKASIVWTFKAQHELMEGAVASADGLLVVPDVTGLVYGVDSVTGKQLWLFNVEDGYVFGEAGISPDSKRAYIGTSSGRIIALDVNTGGLLWNVELGNAIQGSVTVSPTDQVYVACEDSNVYGYNGVNGNPVAKLSTGDGESLFPPVILFDGSTVVVGSSDGFVRAYSAGSHTLRWRYQTKGPVVEVPCVHPATGVVFVGAAQELIAINPSTGDRLWTVPASGELGASPGCGNKHALLYIGGYDGAMHAFDQRDGGERWEFPTADRITSNPVIDKDSERLYVTSTDGTLYVLDASTGDLIWKQFVAKLMHGDPVLLADRSVVVTAADGNIMAKVAYVPPPPQPPAPQPSGDGAGVAVGVTFLLLAVGYVGGGFAYSYWRHGEVSHPHHGFWSNLGSRVSGCCSSCMSRLSPKSVPAGYASSAGPTSSVHSSSAAAATPAPSGGGAGGYGAL